ncbi:MAG: hypothetical protein K8R36_16655, partial [Planctomycetales bacterium]|nr:hypothetical protein [Planctomycetales bacterium]
MKTANNISANEISRKHPDCNMLQPCRPARRKRPGAAKAVLDGTSASNVKGSVVTYMSNGGVTIRTSNVTISPCDPTTAEGGNPVTVTVSLPFSQVSWLPS